MANVSPPRRPKYKPLRQTHTDGRKYKNDDDEEEEKQQQTHKRPEEYKKRTSKR